MKNFNNFEIYKIYIKKNNFFLIFFIEFYFFKLKKFLHNVYFLYCKEHLLQI